MPSSRHRLTLTKKAVDMERYSLDDLEARYLAYHKAKGHTKSATLRHQATLKLYRRFLTDRKQQADSRSLTTEMLNHFAVWLRETPLLTARRGSSVRSIHGVHGALKDMRAFTRWLLEENLIDAQVKVPMPKLPQTLFPILTHEELEQVWTSRYLSGRSGLATRNRALIGLMLDSGLRRSEVANLTLKDLDLFNCQVVVTGKGSKQRRVPFSSSVRVLIEEWVTVRGDEEGRLFWLAPDGVKTVFRRIKDELGLDLFHPHQLRHQAATALVRNHVDLDTVARILGHSELETTRRYLSQSDEDLRMKHAAASPFESLMKSLPGADSTKRKRLSLKAS
jgi:site-specific recombinase XerD